ncbi:MAG TPA: glycosyltransferase [Mucilaginibacter sp.]|jgi:glycosyltransferase involved in cell wall biosynthesis|nr:glycosyltransferase [Mucilaginibacter sp.]
MEPKLLSVVIPTYNRPELLTRLVKQILNFLPHWADLTVLNNASTRFDGFIETFEKQLNSGVFKLVTHKLNVCGDENILRGFEYATADWVWIIGDDDEIFDTSFDIIKKTIEMHQNTDVFHVHFNWEKEKVYQNTSPISTMKELFSSFHSLGDFNFISAGIFKVSSVGAFIYWSHFFQSSGTPLSSVALLGLDTKTGSVLLSNDQIIENGFFSKEKTNFWDIEFVLRAQTQLVEYPLLDENKDVIIDYLNRNLTIWLAVKSAVREYQKGKKISSCIRSYNEILKLKIVYGNIFSRIWISLVATFVMIFIWPMSKALDYLKRKNVRF